MMKCQWFLRCTNESAGTVEHPVLGPVPTCQRCVDMLDLKLDKIKERAN